MPNKLTLFQFVEKVDKTHNGKYDYSLSDYKNSYTKIKIICPEHGEFAQLPSNHFAGKGCPKCKNKKTSLRCRHTTAQFIEKAQKIHKSRYGYSKVNYKKDNLKIKIVCKDHGVFDQTPRSHLNGNGCPKCAGFNKPFQDFVKEANIIHDNKYDYSDNEHTYKGMRQKIKISCGIHGVFLQSPGGHLSGRGCKECGHIKTAQKRTFTTEIFVERAKLIHDNFYDYSKTQYILSKEKVIVICPEHGEFTQTPENHLAGKNCPMCVGKVSKEEIEVVDFLKSLNIRVQTNDRSIITPKELDIVLSDHKIAIEYNGLYWHSSVMRHFNKFGHQEKSKSCKKAGYRLIHIFSDDWRFKKEIIKSILRSVVGKIESKIFARKCICKLIDKKEAQEFLEKNHIQGYVISSVHFGLFFQDKLLQVMSFKKDKDSFNLVRFVTQLNTQVIGGASKLFKYFQRSVEFQSVYTFADLSTFSGRLYNILGFKKVKEIPIDYSYIYQGRRKHKFGFRKKRLKTLLPNFDSNKSELENTQRNGIYRIYDCGKIKYLFQNNC